VAAWLDDCRVYCSFSVAILYFWLYVLQIATKINLLIDWSRKFFYFFNKNLILHLPNLNQVKIHSVLTKKLNLHYARLIPFRMSRVSGAHLRGFAPGSTHQGCNGSESLVTYGRFDRLGIWTPYLSHQKRTSYHFVLSDRSLNDLSQILLLSSNSVKFIINKIKIQNDFSV